MSIPYTSLYCLYMLQSSNFSFDHSHFGGNAGNTFVHMTSSIISWVVFVVARVRVQYPDRSEEEESCTTPYNVCAVYPFTVRVKQCYNQLPIKWLTVHPQPRCSTADVWYLSIIRSVSQFSVCISRYRCFEPFHGFAQAQPILARFVLKQASCILYCLTRHIHRDFLIRFHFQTKYAKYKKQARF